MIRRFLTNFAKRTFTVNDQVRLIHDFLNVRSSPTLPELNLKRPFPVHFAKDARVRGLEKCHGGRVRQCARSDGETRYESALRIVSLQELATESEGLIVIWQFSTFTPQIPRLVPPRPVTTDDLERDHVLAQRISLFGWVEEKHLDVPEEDGSKGFLMFAQQGNQFRLLARKPLTGLDLFARVAESQPLQGPEGQAYLRTQLLQGHLRSEIPLSTLPMIVRGLADYCFSPFRVSRPPVL